MRPRAPWTAQWNRLPTAPRLRRDRSRERHGKKEGGGEGRGGKGEGPHKSPSMKTSRRSQVRKERNHENNAWLMRTLVLKEAFRKTPNRTFNDKQDFRIPRSQFLDEVRHNLDSHKQNLLKVTRSSYAQWTWIKSQKKNFKSALMNRWKANARCGSNE